MNIVILEGSLSSTPRSRTLPSGDELIQYEVTTDAAGDGPRQSVPVSWLRPSRAPRVDFGDQVVVVGTVQRRFFRTGGGTQSRTEVAAALVTKPGSTKARRAVAGALLEATEKAGDGFSSAG